MVRGCGVLDSSDQQAKDVPTHRSDFDDLGVDGDPERREREAVRIGNCQGRVRSTNTIEER